MREVKPESVNSDARLASALRAMAVAAPAEAPREVGDALSKAFRRHHARRRAMRGSTIALAMLAVLFAANRLLVRKPVSSVRPKSAGISPVEAPPATTGTPLRPSAASATPGVRNLKSNRRSAARPHDFVALASFDQAVRDEDLRVVRLELTGRALRLAGAPVSEEMADRRVVADFVVGEDGTPYAVRLVQRKHVLE